MDAILSREGLSHLMPLMREAEMCVESLALVTIGDDLEELGVDRADWPALMQVTTLVTENNVPYLFQF